MNKFFFILFTISKSIFYNWHIISIFTSIAMPLYTYVYVYMYTYTFLFLILKRRTWTPCYFVSSLPFLHPLLQVELVGPGWGRTSTGTQGDQERISPRVLLHFPECYSVKGGHLSNITKQMSGRTLATQFSRLAAHARSPTAAASLTAPHRASLAQPLTNEEQWGKSDLGDLLLGWLEFCNLNHTPTSMPYQYLLRSMGLAPLFSLLG